MTREEGKYVKIGDRVVHKPSGCTGEVRLVIPEWGVEVWVLDHNNARERWWWDSMTIRIPRKIRRFPRPFRFARLKPTKCCHCIGGRMRVVCANTVRCERCKNLIGSESFPRRIARARTMLVRATETGTLPRPRNKKVVAKKKRTTNKPVNRPKKRTPSPKVQGGKKKKAPPKAEGDLGVRPTGGEEVTNGPTATEATPAVPEVAVPAQESPAVPTPEDPKVPEAQKGEDLTPKE